MIHLLPAIQEKLKANETLFTNNSLAAISYVDAYMGQPLSPEEFEFTLPAIFIDYSIDWQQGIIQVDAHVISQLEEETASIFDKRDEGLNYFKTLAIVRHLLTGIKTDYISALKPYSERPATTEYYHYHVLSYAAYIVNGIDNDLIPAKLVDATDVVTVIDKHNLEVKTKQIPIPEIDIFSK